MHVVTGTVDLRTIAARLRAEAIELVDRIRLIDALQRRFGSAAIVGSVDFDLMTWRDIDIYAPVERHQKSEFLEIVNDIAVAPRPTGCELVRAVFNDEWLIPRGDYGSGYYWGLRLRTADAEIWKVDIWGWDATTWEAKLVEHRSLKKELQECDRDLILKLKSEVMALPEFRRSVTSRHVYELVREKTDASLDDLLQRALPNI